jgi:hypothetical protein
MKGLPTRNRLADLLLLRHEALRPEILYPWSQVKFQEYRLNSLTASTATGADWEYVFVNDQLDKEYLTVLSEHGVKLIA